MSQFRGIAHLIEGDTSAVPSLHMLLVQEGFAAEGDPDIYTRTYASFGIDDAREIAVRADTRALGALHRVFIITTPAMTTEAQNALLKTLEEAPGGAAFFLVVPSVELLLPTVRSRCQVMHIAVHGQSIAGVVDPAAFLAAAPSERIEMLKPLLDADERDLAGAYALLGGVERALASRTDEAAVRVGLTAIYNARQYIGDKGSMMKPLLEQVALLVPAGARAAS